jgi:hypothetical protein
LQILFKNVSITRLTVKAVSGFNVLLLMGKECQGLPVVRCTSSLLSGTQIE